MNNLMVAIILLLGFVFIARMINENAMKKLEQDKKAALIDLFSKDRTYHFGILIAIIALFFACINFNLIAPLIAYTIYIVSILTFISITSYNSYQKLKKNDFPDYYVKAYIFSTSLRFIGLMIFFALMKY